MSRIRILHWRMGPFCPLSMLSKMLYLIVIVNSNEAVTSFKHMSNKQTGPSCSKLTTSLVNVSLKFQTLILQIHCYFLLKKCENPLHCKGVSHFSTKINSVFVTLADICLNKFMS